MKKINLVLALLFSASFLVITETKKNDKKTDDDAEMSGSGEEYLGATKSDMKEAEIITSNKKTPVIIKSATKLPEKKPKPKPLHHHHRHHHHHHRHHHHHHHHQHKKADKKSDTSKKKAVVTTTKSDNDLTTIKKAVDYLPSIDLSKIKKTVGELAQTPLSRLMNIFKKGKVRPDIADQTFALLNASLINQNDFSGLYHKEVVKSKEKVAIPYLAEETSAKKKSKPQNNTDDNDDHVSEEDETKKKKEDDDEIKENLEKIESRKKKTKKLVEEEDTMTETDNRRKESEGNPPVKEGSDENDVKRSGGIMHDSDHGSDGDNLLLEYFEGGFKKKENEKEKEKVKEEVHKVTKKNVIKQKTNSSNAEYDVPKNIPSKCAKLVKAYTNGEMTLKDYLKSLKICKRNEEIELKLANTTPQQREAVTTMSLIQQEAYKYAMDSMKNFKTNKQDAESVMDKWRINSFGPKDTRAKSEGNVPDAVKKFMTMQHPSAPSKLSNIATEDDRSETQTKSNVYVGAVNPLKMHAQQSMFEVLKLANSKSIVNPLATNKNANTKDNLLKSNVINPNMKSSYLITNDKEIIHKKNTMMAQAILNTPRTTLSNDDILSKKSLIPHTPITADIFGKKSRIQQPMYIPKSPLYPETLAKKSVIPQKNAMLQTLLNNGLITKKNMIQQNFLSMQKSLPLSAVSGSAINPANLPLNIIENPVPIPDGKSGSLRSNNEKNALLEKIASIEKKIIIPKENLLPVNKLSEIDSQTLTHEPKNKLLLGGLDAQGAVPTSLAAAVESVKKGEIQPPPAISASNIIKELTANAKDGTKLTGEKLAAEQFFASLANPVLGNMPVDTNLLAALNGMGGANSGFHTGNPGHMSQVSRRRRQLHAAKVRQLHFAKSRRQWRHSKRSLESLHMKINIGEHHSKFTTATRTTRKHKRAIHETDYVLMHGKRDTTDNLTSVKPIERSNMGVHIQNNKQGPKLLDKIRDMSRVIATK